MIIFALIIAAFLCLILMQLSVKFKNKNIPQSEIGDSFQFKSAKAEKHAARMAEEINSMLIQLKTEEDQDRIRSLCKKALNHLDMVRDLSNQYPQIKIERANEIEAQLTQVLNCSVETVNLAEEKKPRKTFSSNEIDLFHEHLSRLAEIITESISIAEKTKNEDTFISRLNIAEMNIEELKYRSEIYQVPYFGWEEAQARINELKQTRFIKLGVNKTIDTTVQGPVFKLHAYGPLELPPDPQLTPWLASTALEDPTEYCSQFWDSMREDLDSGNFWYERIKKYRNQPEKRLALALQYLPLPAAFRESAIALRSLIRAAKKDERDYTAPANLLYWLAAIHSFMLEYSSKAKQPGFNVVQYMPGETFLKMDFSYVSLGYRELKLLTLADGKMFAQLWGEPQQHTTLNILQQAVWEKYETLLIELTKNQ